MTKGFYPCLWLLHGKAVKGFDNDELLWLLPMLKREPTV